MKKLIVASLFLASLNIYGLNPAAASQDTLAQKNTRVQKDTLVQVATIDALLGGLYDGVTTINSLKAHGDTGIGTFDQLDGEMVVLDGEVYKVGIDGHVEIVPNKETTPFAAVTFFDSDQELAVSTGLNLESFTAMVDSSVSSTNLFYAFRMEGRFKSVRTRSVPEQQKPYRPLAEVVKDQAFFNFQDVEGVMVGFYCPAFVKGINVPGYHLHFLTADRKAGGHVLGFTVDQAALKIDTLNNFLLLLPETEAFAGVDLQRDRKHELERVEK